MARYAVPLFVTIFAICFFLLKHLLYGEIVVALGLAMLAWTMSDLITKTVQNCLPQMLINPEGKSVFITGCDSGFGYQLAKQLDQMGFQVFAGCLFPGKDGAAKLKEECSDQLKVISLDVTNDELVKAAAKEVTISLNGKELWAVVNNAGIASFTEIEWCPMDTYHKVFDVNALGPVRVTKAFLPLLRESQGRVIIVASLAGRYTFPGFSAYSMSKYAAVSFADGLRREMRKWRISVHTVEPTLYKTPISSEDRVKSILQNSWESTSPEIQHSYGLEYYQAFQDMVCLQLKRAKDNVSEVVDDMIDAVAGKTPKSRYVPSVQTQIRARLLSSLSTELQDLLLMQAAPKCEPAGASKHMVTAADKLRRELRRSQSEPVNLGPAGKILRKK